MIQKIKCFIQGHRILLLTEFDAFGSGTNQTISCERCKKIFLSKKWERKDILNIEAKRYLRKYVVHDSVGFTGCIK